MALGQFGRQTTSRQRRAEQKPRPRPQRPQAQRQNAQLRGSGGGRGGPSYTGQQGGQQQRPQVQAPRPRTPSQIGGGQRRGLGGQPVDQQQRQRIIQQGQAAGQQNQNYLTGGQAGGQQSGRSYAPEYGQSQPRGPLSLGQAGGQQGGLGQRPGGQSTQGWQPPTIGPGQTWGGVSQQIQGALNNPNIPSADRESAMRDLQYAQQQGQAGEQQGGMSNFVGDETRMNQQMQQQRMGAMAGIPQQELMQRAQNGDRDAQMYLQQRGAGQTAGEQQGMMQKQGGTAADNYGRGFGGQAGGLPGMQQQQQRDFYQNAVQQGQQTQQAREQWTGGGMGLGGPYGGMTSQDIRETPVSTEMRNTMIDARAMPWLDTGGMTNPADRYNQVTPGAQQQIGNVMGGEGLYQGPGNNQFLQQGGNILGGMNFGQQQLPGQPNAPNIQGAPTSYDAPTSNMQFGNQQVGQFDPNQVQGPNMPGITGAQGNFGGPGTGTPGWNELVNLSQQTGGQPMAREQLGQVGGLGQSGVGSQAFQQALASGQSGVGSQAFNQALQSAQGMGAAGQIDTAAQLAAQEEMNKGIFSQAAQAGLGAAGGRGFTDPGGTVAGGEMGSRLGQAAQAAAARQSDVMANAAQFNAAQQAQAAQAQTAALTGLGGAASGASQAQMAGLTQLGGAASGAAQGMGGLSLAQQQGLNQGGITQRGQDMNMAQTMAGQGGMGGVADLLRAQTGAETGRFQAGTQRGLGQGELDLQGQGLAQQGALDAYGQRTQRQGVQGGMFNQGQQNITDQFRAETQRGLGQGQVDLGYAQTGLGYNQLGAANQNQFNQAQNQQFQTQAGMYQAGGQMANQAYQNQTQRQQVGIGGAANLGGVQQQGEIAAGQQQLQSGQLANQILQGGAGAQQAMNQLQLLADQGNQQAAYQMWAIKTGNHAQMLEGNRQRNAGLAGAVIGGVTGAAGSYLGSL